ATASYSEVYRGEDGRVHHWQRLAPDGTGFWVGHWSEGYSIRYGWDGAEQERLDAPLGVVESPSGDWRAYDVVAGGDVSAVVEGDGHRFEIGGRAWDVTYSPDERRVSFLHWSEDAQMLRLSLLDLETGEQRELVSAIGPCECDGGPTPMWSPSGRYIS